MTIDRRWDLSVCRGKLVLKPVLLKGKGLLHDYWFSFLISAHMQGPPSLLYNCSTFPCGWTLVTAYCYFSPCFLSSGPWTQFSIFPKYFLLQYLSVAETVEP